MASSYELNHKKSCFRFCETAATTEHVHERATRAKFECHVHILIIFKTFMKVDDVRVIKRAMNLNLCVQLLETRSTFIGRVWVKWATFVLAFFVFNEVLVTTLHANLVPRASFTSYTRANPPYQNVSVKPNMKQITDLSQKSYTTIFDRARLIADDLGWSWRCRLCILPRQWGR